MSFITQSERRAIHFIVKYPKSLIAIAGITFLLLFTGFESLRAWMYDTQVENYRHSARVMELTDAIDRLVVEAAKGGKPEFCDLTLRNNIGGYNAAYQEQKGEDSLLTEAVHAKAQTAVPSPAFHSLLNFLPHIKKRVVLSRELRESTEVALNLTKQDNRSQYCTSLLDVFSEVYFLESIRRPEGVAALSVGQVENFQTNVKKAQTSLASIPVPPIVADEHGHIQEILNSLALHLREDENDFVTFSRRIEMQSVELEMVLETLRDKTADLQAIPSQLYLHVEPLRR